MPPCYTTGRGVQIQWLDCPARSADLDPGNSDH